MSATRAKQRRAGAAPVVLSPWLNWGLALLTVVGLGIAGYLTSTSLGQAALVCGGIGDCDTVHASAYARIMGVPISVLGLGSYVAIAGLLAVHFLARGASRYLALLGVLAVAVSGTVFSIYLTYVELFVIDAICPWCMASALTLATLVAVAGVAVARESADS